MSKSFPAMAVVGQSAGTARRPGAQAGSQHCLSNPQLRLPAQAPQNLRIRHAEHRGVQEKMRRTEDGRAARHPAAKTPEHTVPLHRLLELRPQRLRPAVHNLLREFSAQEGSGGSRHGPPGELRQILIAAAPVGNTALWSAYRWLLAALGWCIERLILHLLTVCRYISITRTVRNLSISVLAV